MLAVLLVAGLGGLAWLVLRPCEPVYQGKPLSFWLGGYYSIQRERTGDEASYNQGAKAVRQAGTNAIPILLRLLRAKDTVLTFRILRLAQKQPFIKLRHSSALLRSTRAAEGFAILGADGKGAVPALIEIYEQNLPETRLATVAALGSIGPAAKPAVPLLLQGLNATNYYVRAAYITALGQIHGEPALVVPALLGFLYPDIEARGPAAEALGKFGPEARRAVPALVALLNDNAMGVRASAATALKAIDPEAADKAGVE